MDAVSQAVVVIQVRVDVAAGETYEQTIERAQAALDDAFPERWRGVFVETSEQLDDD